MDPLPTWRSRGYLPHFEAAQLVQHVTYHLADSLPAHSLARFEDELTRVPPERQAAARRTRIEAWLDAGHGSCVLRSPETAEMVQTSFLHFDTVRYRLLAWVVMPNHVHVLFEPLESWTVARIVVSWKTFTGRRVAEYRDTMDEQRAWRTVDGGQVWQREYWDRFIRDERHFLAAREYIHYNPVRAGLVAEPQDWLWSRARIQG